MSALLWFLTGAVVGALPAALILCGRRRPALPQPRREEPRPTPAAGWPRPASDARALAATLADQLAGLTSAVEGHAHLLIEAAASPELVPRAAERLWQATHRLRQFQGKLRAYVQKPPREPGPTEVAGLLAGLREELERWESGLEVSFHVPRALPPLRGSRAVLQDALLCTCSALVQLERGATRLTVSAEPHFDGAEPGVSLELHLEWVEDPTGGQPPPANLTAFELEQGAARNLVASQGGELTLLHRPGNAARALLRLPAVVMGADGEPGEDEVAEPVAGGPRHDFGGVLLLEADPTLRAMLAGELKAHGRNVFACADGAAVRSLLQATPERFELLIVDHESPVHSAEVLAAAAARLCPELKVCVLDRPGPPPSLPPELEGRVHRLGKPFGVHELRATLDRILVP